MGTIVIPQRFAQRYDTAANWTAKNPVLWAGEIAYGTDTTGKVTSTRVGDGAHQWADLAEVGGGGGSGIESIVAGANISIDDTDPTRPVISASGGGGAVDRGADPHWSNVVSLLQYRSVPTALFEDSAGIAWTNNSGVTATNFLVPAGFTGRNVFVPRAYLSAPNSPAWQMGGDDFTIEAILRVGALPGSGSFPGIVSQRANNTSNHGWALALLPNAAFALTWSLNGSTPAEIDSPTNTVVANKVVHVAAVRSGSNLLLFYEGGIVASATLTGSLYASTEITRVGRLDSTDHYLTGDVHAIRVTKGTARYTAAFAPPHAPFAEHA